MASTKATHSHICRNNFNNKVKIVSRNAEATHKLCNVNMQTSMRIYLLNNSSGSELVKSRTIKIVCPSGIALL